ncbi:YbaY family lipoprotein [Photobacterium leiognathi]|uniref:YbaY family lipoprotein n=1 Tax=Photobacterium leiognathi TaxID=553611 RepID=UPI0027399B79|nr:YbaY family lipoprotein [Photobacterium leiognathi]
MKNSFAWFGLLLAVLVITACTNFVQTDSDIGTLQGTVSYRERIVLPNNARIVVSLVETNTQDNNSSKVISQHSFLAEGAQPPVEFTLQYMKSKIQSDTSYRVVATIEVDDKLLFSNQSTKALNIDPLTTMRVDIPLAKA